MQEDIENRAVALAIKSVKLTGHGLKVAIAKYLAHRKEQKLHMAPIGRQTVKQLMRQGQSVSNIEITDGNCLVIRVSGLLRCFNLRKSNAAMRERFTVCTDER